MNLPHLCQCEELAFGVKDARVAPDGRLVLALTGIGVRFLRPSGKPEVDIDVPTDEVIISDNGLRLLALRRLGDQAIAIASVVLPERQTRHLGEVPATTWAQTYDGASWFLAHHDQLWMLDMLPEGSTALWRQDHPGGPIAGIARSPAQLAVASASGTDPRDGSPIAVIRRYALPALQELDALHRPFRLGGILMPSGDVADGDAGSELYRASIERTDGEAHTVVAKKVGIEAPVAVVRLSDATDLRTRIDRNSLIVFDGLGRVEVVELDTGGRRSYRAVV